MKSNMSSTVQSLVERPKIILLMLVSFINIHSLPFLRSLAPNDPPEIATGVANLADLVKFLKERFGGGGGVIIALKNAERLRDMDGNLLPGFLRLRELTRLPVCVLLISKIAWEALSSHAYLYLL